jgi:hypothetical protein
MSARDRELAIDENGVAIFWERASGGPEWPIWRSRLTRAQRNPYIRDCAFLFDLFFCCSQISIVLQDFV